MLTHASLAPPPALDATLEVCRWIEALDRAPRAPRARRTLQVRTIDLKSSEAFKNLNLPSNLK